MTKIIQLAASADRVIDALEHGETVTTICERLNIAPGTWRNWVRSDPEFGDRVDAAMQVARDKGLRRGGGRPRTRVPSGAKLPSRERDTVDFNRIYAALAAGHPRGHSAALANVNPAQMEQWLAEDPEFLIKVEQAEAMLQSAMLERIMLAAEDPRQWMAAAWVLERRWGDTYARKTEVSRTERTKTAAKIGSELAQVVLQALQDSGMDPDQQQEVRERMARAVDAVAQQAS